MKQKNSSQDKILIKEWKAVKKEYPNFSLMFIENNALLVSLIKQTKGEYLKELVGSYTERSCLLGLLPKCPEIDPCEVIRLKCEKIRNESPKNPDGLDASDVIDYGECMIKYHECKNDTLLCCE